MEDLNKLLASGFAIGQAAIDENEKRFQEVDARLEAFLQRATQSIMQKQLAVAKPQKRLKTVAEAVGDKDPETVPVQRSVSSQELSALRESAGLRPLRTAKVNANMNLKQLPSNLKMRNDNNNVVVIKTERISSKSSSLDSVKENKVPSNDSPQIADPIVESVGSTEKASTTSSKRSDSIVMLVAKAVEIDITSDCDADKMPPPPAKKEGKKPRTRQKKPAAVIQQSLEPVEPQPLRVTRSKIKQEKVSLDQGAQSDGGSASVRSDVTTTVAPSKKGKKKYPMPILIKMEATAANEAPVAVEKEQAESVRVSQKSDETFNVVQTVKEAVEPKMNETVTIEPRKSENPNATITLDKNLHESLMTEDNDDMNESSEDLPLAQLKVTKPPQLPLLKLKKNEVFNPYLSSPVKQKVQAFEKHANQSTATPDRFKPSASSSKYHTLKAGTPSKIALFTKTTPLSVNKTKLTATASSGSVLLGSSSGYKQPKPLKKMHSLSQESLEETTKQRLQQSNEMTRLLEEKRKAREEKQRQAQLQREALEKEKRDQALKLQIERDEKYRKIMKEKEEKQRLEALKKKTLKEKQAKKYAEEKAKKDEFLAPKPPAPEPQSASKDDSLLLRLQKQKFMEKAAQQKKEATKNCYDFEMLHTDDSTDDESRPSQKRPPPPAWSKKSTRKPLIVMQSKVDQNVLDSLFSVQPLSVDLKEIFPAIDSRKLIRNSSAIWRTPPKHNYNH